MGDIVLVPIHLDALCLHSGQSVTEATANFDRLPYFNGKRDVYSNTVNLSESVVSKPFQNQNLYLKPGIHLHWALPNGLTTGTGVQGQKGIEFPAAPNRWLIIRRQNSQETKRWVVESDYLHPPENGYQENSITYPVTYPYTDTNKCKEAPRFCYLGRQLTWDKWLEESKKTENKYLDKITVIGYGEATFAAFYPNCHSVFGFYDSFDGQFTSAKNVEYDVFGWYSDSKQDYSRKILENFRTSDQFKQFEINFTDEQILEHIKNEGFLQYLSDTKQTHLHGIVKDGTKALTKEKDYCIGQLRIYFQSQELKKALIDKLKWDIRDLKSLNNQTLCYARLSFPSNPSTSNNSRSAKVSLAVGNTGGEAIAAYLANSIAEASQKTIIEEQLALIDLTDSTDSLNSDRPDFGAIFQQRQHQNSFNALAGGLIWEITAIKDSNQQENNQNSSSPIGLPQSLMTELNQLNQKQQEYNCHQAEVDSMRFQLFSDWYKYMVSCYPLDTWDNYPDIDEIKSYIQTCGIEPLAKKDTKTKDLKGKLGEQIEQLSQKIADYNQELQKKVDNLTKVTFKLEQVADARYWQPKEPVVLIVEDTTTGNALKATDRYDRNEVLGCTVLLNKTIDDLIEEKFQSVVDKIKSLSDNLPKTDKPTFWGLQAWEQQPWNPFLLEWLVEFFPVKAPVKSNSLRRYGSNFLTDNYILAEHDFELSPKESYQVSLEEEQINHIVTDQDCNTYSGSSILTPYAALALQQKLEELAKKDPPQTKDTINNPVYTAIAQCKENLDPDLKNRKNRDRQLEAYIRARVPHNYPRYDEVIKIDKRDFFSKLENLEHLRQWYETKKLQTIPSFSKTVAEAKKKLAKVNCLSQALGGFNAALLMHKQTLQLNIDDPIGFPDYQKFTNDVHKAIANCNTVAPQPLDRFNPVRSGEMKIFNLRLIDTFGQIKDLTYPEKVVVPKTLKSKQSERVYLPPRIVQPVRINFDWLPAETSSQDSSSNFTPICGWIVPNNLDHSLFIYSNRGEALGSIEKKGKWMYAPGNLQMELEDIPNPHLKKMVKKLCQLGKQDENFINNFENTLNNALENIELEQLAQSNVASLLVGRPIALVRASINLELRGLPAVNQNWQIFRQDMRLERKNECQSDRRNSKTERETDGFTEINVPIRVGEFQQFNDGVIGYWKEKPVGAKGEGDYEYEHDIFYAQQSDAVESAHIETQYWDIETNTEINDQTASNTNDALINVIQTLEGSSQTITMLIDPCHSVHVSAGILPSKVVTIPPEQYVPIIQAIQVSFLTSPLLSDRDSYNFPLPKIPQHSWTWLEKQQEQWDHIYDFPTIDRSVWLRYLPLWQKHFSVVSTLENGWELLIEAGWLKVIPGQPIKAAIVSPDKRPQNDQGIIPLTGLLKGQDQTIAQSLESYKEHSWQLLIDAGWLKIIPGQPIKAAIIDPKNRPQEKKGKVKPLTGLLEGLDQEIDLFFDLYQVDLIPASTQGNFTQTQRIREGWLVLKKVKDR